MSTPKRPSISVGQVPSDPASPQLIELLRQIVLILEIDSGRHDDNDKRPTKQQMIDAGIANADKL